MTNYEVQIDRVFNAMSDPTRMAVLARLSKSEASAGELAKPFDMALPSFMQHMAVLEEVALVSSEKKGRVRIYQLEPETLKRAENWLEKCRRDWEQRLNRLDNYLMKMKGEEND